MTVQIEKESFYRTLNKLSGEQFNNANFPAHKTVNNSRQINIIKSV